MKKLLVTTAALICLTANAQNLQWANSTGSANSEYGFAIAIDNSGNSFSTGYFKGTVDFDPGPATFNLVSAATSYDIFISKTDAAGNFVWAKKIGGTGNEGGSGIAVDANGDVYVTGHFYMTVDFDPGTGTNNLISTGGGADIYIVKLNASGNFLWAKQMGGSFVDYSLVITVDALNNVYTSGYFDGPADFDPGPGVFNLTGTYSVFISKLDANGNFVWAKNIIGNSTNEPRSVSLDAAGNIYVAGFFAGTTDFDPGAGTANLTSAGFDDAFILKLDQGGNFIWAKQMGGAQYDAVYGMTTDAAGNIYCTGYFKGTADFDPGAATYNLTPGAGLCDVFISKTDSSGNFVWAKQIGGGTTTGGANAYAIALDHTGNVYSTGQFNGADDFDPGNGIFSLTSIGSSFDMYVSKLDAAGNFVWATRMGGTALDCGRSLVIDALDNIYLTGRFAGAADFDPGAATFNLVSNGSDDIFVMKMSQSTTGLSPILIIDEPSVIYPNPSSGIFYTELKTTEETKNIEVYNSIGEKVFSTFVNKTAGTQKTITLDLSDLPKGIYLAVTLSSGNRTVKKIILQ